MLNGKPLVRVSANYYPPLPPDAPPSQFGTSPHTDYGVITLLWQDDRGGLELRHRSGSWHPATPKPGTFVVNIGDLLAANARHELDVTRMASLRRR